MDKKSKILFTVAIITIIVSVGITFYRTAILKDFNIEEPETELSE